MSKKQKSKKQNVPDSSSFSTLLAQFFARQSKFPLSYEASFVVLGLIFGLMFVFINPPFHSNDEDRHFLKAYHLMETGIMPEISPDSSKIGGMLPVNLINVVGSFQGVPYHLGKKLDKRTVAQRAEIPLNENQKIFHNNMQYKTPPFSYYPHMIGLAIGKQFNSNPVSLGYSARIGGLFFYLIVMFIIISKVPVYKEMFFMLGLTPMALYQMGSVTYDLFNYLAVFSFFAIFLYYTFTDSAKVTTKSLIFFILLAILSHQTKKGYFLLPLVMLLIPNKKFDIKFNINIIKAIVGIFFLYLATRPYWVWPFVMSDVKLGAGHSFPKFQTDFRINAGEQMQLLMGDPLGTIVIIWKNILHFRHEWLGGIMGRFGYSYSLLPNAFFMFHGIVLIVVAFICGREKYEISNIKKWSIFSFGALTALAIIVGFLRLSPVGAEMIFGLQGRYFLPTVPFILFLLYNSSIKIPIWEKWGSTILTAYCFVMLSYVYGQMDILFYEF